jgi:hypothetical protein
MAAVFWDVKSCSLTDDSEEFTAYITWVIIEAVSSSETSVNNLPDYTM